MDIVSGKTTQVSPAVDQDPTTKRQQRKTIQWGVAKPREMEEGTVHQIN